MKGELEHVGSARIALKVAFPGLAIQHCSGKHAVPVQLGVLGSSANL